MNKARPTLEYETPPAKRRYKFQFFWLAIAYGILSMLMIIAALAGGRASNLAYLDYRISTSRLILYILSTSTALVMVGVLGTRAQTAWENFKNVVPEDEKIPLGESADRVELTEAGSDQTASVFDAQSIHFTADQGGAKPSTPVHSAAPPRMPVADE